MCNSQNGSSATLLPLSSGSLQKSSSVSVERNICSDKPQSCVTQKEKVPVDRSINRTANMSLKENWQRTQYLDENFLVHHSLNRQASNGFTDATIS
jgi:hypothetical protein